MILADLLYRKILLKQVLSNRLLSIDSSLKYLTSVDRTWVKFWTKWKINLNLKLLRTINCVQSWSHRVNLWTWWNRITRSSLLQQNKTHSEICSKRSSKFRLNWWMRSNNLSRARHPKKLKSGILKKMKRRLLWTGNPKHRWKIKLKYWMKSCKMCRPTGIWLNKRRCFLSKV